MSSLSVEPTARLLRTGERLPQRLRAAILDRGDTAVPALLAILNNEELADADRPYGGWAPIHAVDLLADLKAVAAVGPMLDRLAVTDFDEVIHDHIALRLPDIGPAVLEPALARLPARAEDAPYGSLCCVLAHLELEDERIYQALCTLFAADPVLGGILLADYGDTRALPLLDAAIRDFEPDVTSAIHPDLVDLVESYEILGGPLPEELRAKADGAMAAWRAARAALEPAKSPKVGRNDPCPCGSGKKHKRCCLGAASA